MQVLAEVLTIAFVLGALDFGVAALFAQLLQRLAAHAQMIFHLREARAASFPFLFEFLLARIQADFFCAQCFELAAEFFALQNAALRFRP